MFRTASLAAFVLAVAAGAAAQPQPPGQAGRYFVEFDTIDPAASNAIRSTGGATVHEFPGYNVIAAQLPEAAVQALRNNPRVRSITEDVPRFPFATEEVVPYGISMVEADQLFAGGAIGQVKVCVIDSGYFTGHVDLPASGMTGTNNSGTGNWYQDGCGHGTHVAGTIAALSNGVGVVGVLPDGNLPMHIVKVFSDSCGWAYSSDLINALNTCRNSGARVVSMSLGGRKPIGPWEERAFNDAYAAGVLSIAAAGNAGNTALSYPASYNSVISVAAIDSNKVVADFSQRNSQIELAAPGVGVLSTVPYIETNTLSISGGATFSGFHIDASGRTNGAAGNLADGGRCTTTGAGSWSGRVVLCERGDISFKAKIDNVSAGGGVAAVIYNNVSGGFLGTCDDGTGSSCFHPAISLSREDGLAALRNIGMSSTVVSHVVTDASGYEEWNGTSMATPHVSGVAALIWSHGSGWTNVQIRQALRQTAEDLGPAGRDDAYGYGLVRAKAALCYLAPDLCGATPVNNPPAADFTFTTSGRMATFTDGSSDSDGTVVSWSWTFGDGGASTAQNPSHTYAVDGTYTVTLTVTDDDGATGSTSKDVTVSSSTTPPQAITLNATGYKVKGLQKADLTWSGATSTTSMDIYRNKALVTTASDSGAHTDDIDNRGGGSYTYRVCEAGTSICSNEATISF